MLKSKHKIRIKKLLFILKKFPELILKKRKLIKGNDIKKNKKEILNEFKRYQYIIKSFSLEFLLDEKTEHNGNGIQEDIDLTNILIRAMLYDRRN